MKILRTDKELECPGIESPLRDQGHDLVSLPGDITEADLARASLGASLILTCYTPITRKVIETATSLKGIVKYGVGIDAIDVEAAIEQGVPVVNIPHYAEETVAEGAFALLIALARRLMPLHAKMQAEGWDWPHAPRQGSDIAGKTIGLVGVGRIGQAMARMMGCGFRARVLGYDPHQSTDALHAIGVERRDDLHQMLAECDFVSVHSTLTPQTRKMIGAHEFACMKPGALFINVSRGAIVDEAALVRALESGHLGGAALDVFSEEPLQRHGHPLSPLFDMENVILSPHLTFYTSEAMARLEAETLERCDEIINGRPVKIRSTNPRLRAQNIGVIFEA